jgi:hypothetical protein
MKSDNLVSPVPHCKYTLNPNGWQMYLLYVDPIQRVLDGVIDCTISFLKYPLYGDPIQTVHRPSVLVRRLLAICNLELLLLYDK